MKQEKQIWEQSRVELFRDLNCREAGLSQEDAAERLAKYGANELHAGKQKSVLRIFHPCDALHPLSPDNPHGPFLQAL